MADRILLMRLSSLGDVILTTPTARAVRRTFPKARIAFLTYARYLPVYANNPRVNAAIGLEDGPAGAAAALKRLRKERFDLSIDLHGKRKTALLARLAGIPRRAGVGSARSAARGNVHAVRQGLRALQRTGVLDRFGPADEEMEFFTSAADDRAAARLLEGAARPRVGFFPGASWIQRMWMPERFAETANRVIDRLGGSALVTGGPHERDRVARIAEMTGGRARAFLDLPLGTLAALIRGCDLFVSCDSGPMHLSAAVQTPTAGLFGPGNRDRFRLLGARHANLWESIACSPCKQFRNHCANNACMRLLTVERVWRVVQARLAAAGLPD